MIVFDRKLTNQEKKHNERVVKSIDLIDFIKNDSILEVYENKGIYVQADRNGSGQWTIGIRLDELENERLNKLRKTATNLKEDLYFECRKEVMKGIKNSEYIGIRDLNKDKQREFDKLYENGKVKLINTIQDQLIKGVF